MTDSPQENAPGKLRVLFLTRKWPPAVGGMEVFSAELARELEQLTELDLVHLPGRDNGLPPSPGQLIAFGFKALWRLAWRRKRYDAVLIGDLALSPLAIWLRLTGFRGRVLVAAHGVDIAYAGYPGLPAFLYKTMLRVVTWAEWTISSVAANSRATAERCRKMGFKRITVVPLGVRREQETDMVAAACPSRDLVFVGRVAPRKGVAWFIREVMPKLPEDVGLRIIGTVWSDEERETIENHPRVHLAGSRHGNALVQERRNALAVIMPNVRAAPHDFEGFGLVAVEASAQGAVLLAAGLDGIVDAVIDGETGFVLPPDDADRWAAKVMEIASWTPEQRTAFTARAATATLEHYTWAKVAGRYAALMTDAGAGHPTSG